MSIDGWKSFFDIGTLVLLFLVFAFGAGVWFTGDIINKRQSVQLRQFDKDLTGAKKDLAESNAKAEGFRLDIAKANESAAEAEARASEAKLELARFRAPRNLDLNQQKRIASILSGLNKRQRVDVTASPLTVESGSLVEQILSALQMASIGASWFQGNNISPLTGAAAVSEVVVFATHDKRSIDFSEALASALSAEGITASLSVSMTGCKDVKVDPDDPYCFMVLVVVGPKK